MSTPRVMAARWRALLTLLWSAGRWRAALYGALVVVLGLLPSAVILATGALVEAIPAAVRHGVTSPQGEPALRALAVMVAALAAAALGGNGLWQLCRVLDAAYALEVHRTVARVTLGTPGVAPLEDPALADQLQAVHEAERRGVLRGTTTELSTVAQQRIRGAGAFVVLLAFGWWAPFLLAAAWQLTNLAFLKKTERMVAAEMGDAAVGLRRAEYLWSLSLEPSAAKELRVFGLGGWSVARYGDAMLDSLGILWRSRRSSMALHLAAIAALVASHAVVLGALAQAGARGELGVAALLVFVQAVLATSDLGLVGDSQWELAHSLAIAERVAALRAAAGDRLLPAAAGAEARPAARLPAGSSTEAAASGRPGGARPARRGPVAVRLEGVRFTYRGRPRPTLDGLELEIPAGQSLAVVGENGAGKSTLIKLLCGLYEPDAGRITLDGALSPLQARGRVGVIFQDFVRYKLPLRENVAFGHLPLIGDDAALAGVLRDAGGAGVLASLPGGWDTVLSREFEGGADLSGGQWQRIALARALAAVRGGAGLLILDEPTASLDVRAETELFERFLELTRGATTILVSHRLSSVRRADRIVVIDGGRVVEDGSHDRLMAAGGRYATLFSLQAERFAAAPASAAPDPVEVADA